MGKTYRNFKGEEYPDKSKKKTKGKKFFGYTSGNHTDTHRVSGSTRFEAGKLVADYETRPPVKGQDFIKYGWPTTASDDRKDVAQAKRRGYHEQ